MRLYFEVEILQPDSASRKRKVFVLYGLGGSGKTQIALKFAELHRHWYSLLIPLLYFFYVLLITIIVLRKFFLSTPVAMKYWKISWPTLQSKWRLGALHKRHYNG